MNEREAAAQVSGLMLLIEWANDRDHWIRKLVADVIATRSELSDPRIADLSELFLREKGLIQGEQPNVEEIVASEVSAPAAKALQIVSIEHIENVNALEPDQKIAFHPRLTICFGENASGKTGYVRILKRAAAVRTAQPILSNIHTDTLGQTPRVTIKIKLDDEERTIDWQGEEGVELLSRVNVFDARAAVVHLAEDLSYSYTPADLSLFPLVLNGIERVQKKLQAISVERRPGENSFASHFQRESELYAKINDLGPSTDLQEIDTLAQVSDEEETALHGLRERVTALRSGLTRTQIAAVNQEKDILEGVLSIAEIVVRFDHEAYREAIVALRTARTNLEQATREALTGENVPGILGEAWRQFIEAAEGYVREIDLDPYPEPDAPCIYCRQPLDDAAVGLLQKYRDYCNAQFRQALEEATERVDALCGPVASLSLEVTQREIDRISQEYEDSESQNPAIPAAMEVIRHAQLVQEAVAAEEDYPLLSGGFQEARNIVRAASKDAETILTDLDSQSEQREQTLASEQRHLLQLEDRLKLRALMPAIRDYVKATQWADRCARNLQLFPGIKRSLTDTAKHASDEVLNRRFQDRFQEECESLRAPSVTLNFPGRVGQTRRRKLLSPKHSLGEILSEGEQKVIALADFLAEASLSPDDSPIVLDDPVTSLDHKRLSYVVNRLFELSQHRQVIVLTHDIWFAAELLDRFGRVPQECWFYEVTSEDQRIGLTERRSHPRTDTFNDRKRQIEDLIGQAQQESGEKRQALVVNGYEALRGACEIVVEKDLLRGVIERYRPNVRMTVLDQIRVDRLSDAIRKVLEVFDRCSGIISSHSQPQVTRGVQPTLDELRDDWQTLQDARQGYRTQ